MTSNKLKAGKFSPSAVYQSLLNQVKKTLIEGQWRIEAERVRTYWETGRLIHSHILKHADRAEYGAKVVVRLAKDLKIHPRLLQRCIQFAKTYPRLPIVSGRTQFTWSHYRELITVGDHKKRRALEEAASRHAWSADELAVRIESDRSAEGLEPKEKSPVSQKLLTPSRGQLYSYRLVERPTLGLGEDSGLLIDCGFGFFRDVDPRVVAQFAKDDIVQSFPKEDAYRFSKADRTPKDLYTYNAYVEKVIDGDTLKVRLDLGFDTWHRETLRLRGIDCPEMDTKEGQEAKAFVQSLVKETARLIVRSSRPEKYARYLADVFIPQNGEPNAETDIYLNNLLLKKGYAKRME